MSHQFRTAAGLINPEFDNAFSTGCEQDGRLRKITGSNSCVKAGPGIEQSCG
jgi:hypothetical protein